MGTLFQDTICAIATPIGEGGIGVLRISGEKAVEVASALIRLRSGRPLSQARSHLLNHADILDPDGTSVPLDEALVAVMRAPHSYTGEDVVEIQAHGSPLVLQAVCEAMLRKGARLADPGEFTRRAFLNGRLDLTQAEAVLDTIRSKTAAGLRLAQEQLRGALSREVSRLGETLIGILAHVEAAIDFTEEDITFIQRDDLKAGLRRTIHDIARLIESSKEGRILREGVTAAIIGRPNVGKSSLLNALLMSDRAIVTPIPGTTRDVLEEVLNIRGVPVRLLDTAGVRHTGDPVEQEGVRRSRAAMEQAELLLLVLDGSCRLTEEDESLLIQQRDKKRVVVVNKSDLPCLVADAAVKRLFEQEPGEPATVVHVSAKDGTGLDELRDAVRTLVLRADFEPSDGALVARLRHRDALVRANDALDHALGSAESALSGEFVAMDLRAAIDALGEITGAVTTDDILDRIFREFCIGK